MKLNRISYQNRPCQEVLVIQGILWAQQVLKVPGYLLVLPEHDNITAQSSPPRSDIFTPGSPGGPTRPEAPFVPGSPGSPLGPDLPGRPSYLTTGRGSAGQLGPSSYYVQLTHLSQCRPSDLSDLADQTDLLFPGNIKY